MFFDHHTPVLRSGVKTETDLWEYKRDAPQIGKTHLNAWAHCAKDVLALHNNLGGLIFFGITNHYSFVGASPPLDSKTFNDQIKKFLPDTIWVEFHREFIQSDQRYLGVALIPPRAGPLVRFRTSAPQVDGVRLFEEGDSALRENDSCRVLKPQQVEEFNRHTLRPQTGAPYYVDEPFYRIPQPDYGVFVERQEPCEQIEAALKDPRSAVAHPIGFGGVGKTALATWAAIRAYESKQFAFIVSVTAKDRELTAAGIAGLQPELTSFETLLNAVADVLQYPEYKALPVSEREERTRELLKDSGGLLYVDNLETVDDARIVTFLETLPVGVRALVTSRRLRVRFSAYPITLGPLKDDESIKFVRTLAETSGFVYAKDMRDEDAIKLADDCNRIPLAIRWILGRSTSVSEALKEADALSAAGHQGEQLLEFCFRRVFELMSEEEKTLTEVLSLFTQAQPTEVLLVGADLTPPDVQDALGSLMTDAIIQCSFDESRNDDCYSLLPITRVYVYAGVQKKDGVEKAIRKRLTDYFEAKDILNEDERIAIRQVRQGTGSSDSALIDLATSAKRRGDIGDAEDLLNQAITRNPKSWKAPRDLAEIHRHDYQNLGQAMVLYERAVANAPKDAFEQAKLYREWGLLTRETGEPGAAEHAAERLEHANELYSRDPITAMALTQIYEKRGHYGKTIRLLEPWVPTVYGKFKDPMLEALERAYTKSGDPVKAADIKRRRMAR